MSVSVSVLHTVELPGEGAILANVVGDELYIYPRGLGFGPAIIMSKADWRRISKEVRLAFARRDKM